MKHCFQTVFLYFLDFRNLVFYAMHVSFEGDQLLHQRNVWLIDMESDHP